MSATTRWPGMLTGLSRCRERATRLVREHPALALTVLALVVRGVAAWRAPLSLDETIAVSEALAFLDRGEPWNPDSYNLQAPLFPLLNAMALAVLGGSGGWLRLIPVAASTLTVPVLYHLFRVWLRDRDAFIAGLAVVASPFLVFYAKEARPYALYGLGFAAFALAFVRWDAGRAGRWAFVQVPLLALATVACQFSALLTLGCFFLIAGTRALHTRSWGRLGATVGMGAATALALGPLAAFGWSQMRDVANAVPYWEVSSITLPAMLAEQLFFVQGNGLPENNMLAVHVLLLVLMLIPVVTEARSRRREGEPLDALFQLWWVPVVPLAIASIPEDLSLLYYPRIFIAGAPLLLAIWAIGTLRLMRANALQRFIGGLGAFVFLLLGGLVALSSPLHPEYSGRHLAAEFRSDLAARVQPRDIILVHHGYLAPYIEHDGAWQANVRPLAGELVPGDATVRHRQIAHRLENLPRQRRVVLLLNALAENGVADVVAATLVAGGRPQLDELPCWSDDREPVAILCTRILVFDRKTATAAGKAR